MTTLPPRIAFAAAAAVMALGVAVSVHAIYGSTTADDDVKDSCKDYSVDGSGVLSATCNVWDSHEKVFDTRDHTIDLDDKIGYKDGALKYNESDFSDDCDSETVSLASDQLELKATCSSKIVKIRIDDMIGNEGRSFGGHTPGLYWRAARYSD